MRALIPGLMLCGCVAGALTPQEERGKHIFQACSGCHNVLTDARKAGPSLRTLYGKVRLRNGKRAMEDNVAQLVLDGYNGMPSYRNMFRAEEWADLLAYLRTLRGRPEIGAVLAPIRGSDRDVLAAGSRIFDSRCRSCHEGPAATAPGLRAIYSRERLASGQPVKETTIIARVRDGHSGDDGLLDNASVFALLALLKAQ